ncbi:MAG: methionyl-tRNA formyltransferase [Coprobacillus sp.]|nr:methionyl-tRNA formyltransferase [Coprobacillus sp.]
MEEKKQRLIYFGTPKISAEVLETLIDHGYNIVGVVAQPDKEVGRSAKREVVPTKQVALAHHIPVFQPVKLKDDYSFIEEAHPDAIITFSFGQIIPQVVLDIPRVGCLNIHGSLLPKYRGASPVQAAIIHREKVTGVSLMEMSAKMDAGCVYATKECEIDPKDNSETLFAKIETLAKEIILENLDKYLRGELVGVEQKEEDATFCYTVKSSEEKLDLTKSVDELVGWILALSPTPGGYLIYKDQKLKVFDAQLVDKTTSYPLGYVIEADKHGFFVQGSDGVISLLSLQLEGKKKMDYLSFVNGHPYLVGEYLS